MMFQNREDAGRKLAKKLEWLKKENLLVLAVPRGGVIIGNVIASELNAKLDIIVSRKVGAPDNPEFAIGAVMHDGSYFPNERITIMLNVPQNYINQEIAVQMKEIDRRLIRFRGSKEYDLEGKTIVLVDDGIATGATMFVAALWIKKQKPKFYGKLIAFYILFNVNSLKNYFQKWISVILHCYIRFLILSSMK